MTRMNNNEMNDMTRIAENQSQQSGLELQPNANLT
jgi:hypothetical protein